MKTRTIILMILVLVSMSALRLSVAGEGENKLSGKWIGEDRGRPLVLEFIPVEEAYLIEVKGEDRVAGLVVGDKLVIFEDEEDSLAFQLDPSGKRLTLKRGEKILELTLLGAHDPEHTQERLQALMSQQAARNHVDRAMRSLASIRAAQLTYHDDRHTGDGTFASSLEALGWFLPDGTREEGPPCRWGYATDGMTVWADTDASKSECLHQRLELDLKSGALQVR